MSVRNVRRWLVTTFLVMSALFVTHAAARLLPAAFEALSAQAADGLRSIASALGRADVPRIGSMPAELEEWRSLVWVELPLLAVLLPAALRLRAAALMAAGTGAVVAVLAAAYAALVYGDVLVNVPRPVLFGLGATVASAAYRAHLDARARAVLRHSFDAHFPPPIVDKLMSHAEPLTGVARRRELTVLISGVEGFETRASAMEPARVRALLNEYFELMTEIVFRHHGTVDKFIGDRLVAFFGDPEPQPDHALRCVRAAIEMQAAARTLDGVWRSRGEMPCTTRIGIDTGELIVGDLGSARRVSYSVLGEAIERARELEANSPPGGILVSARTYDLVQGAIPARATGPVAVDGHDGSGAAYEILGIPMDTTLSAATPPWP